MYAQTTLPSLGSTVKTVIRTINRALLLSLNRIKFDKNFKDMSEFSNHFLISPQYYGVMFAPANEGAGGDAVENALKKSDAKSQTSSGFLRSKN